MIEETKSFYRQIGTKFSQTRQASSPGWEPVKKLLKETFKDAKISIADLGCGNGRFFTFIQDLKVDYTGYDTDNYLLNVARKTHPSAKLVNKDVLNDLHTINERYDVVTIFGLTHHIPDHGFRKNWFNSIKKILKEDGLLIISFWNFDKDSRFQKAEPINPGTNDYYLDFDNMGVKRYFHKYSSLVLKNLLSGYTIVETYDADGRNNKLNKYYLLKQNKTADRY